MDRCRSAVIGPSVTHNVRLYVAAKKGMIGILVSNDPYFHFVLYF